MNKPSKITMAIDDVQFDVGFYYYPGLPASAFGSPGYCYPDEYEQVEIDTVSKSGTDSDIRITLPDETLNKIEAYILENYETPTIEAAKT